MFSFFVTSALIAEKYLSTTTKSADKATLWRKSEPVWTFLTEDLCAATCVPTNLHTNFDRTFEFPLRQGFRSHVLRELGRYHLPFERSQLSIVIFHARSRCREQLHEILQTDCGKNA
eukprot:TRINITY_DN4586_c0_g1_i1.p1 TRINITY_DN4586_c0_g1~~TRINITY_DN4586_c0_g1_i1.p1  ORF type:complete len:117 (-),score=8.67 TRINITY_DN4586_c0_g1_i1:31-381(-)